MPLCHCHDRPIILLHCVPLSRSHSRWAYIKHILDLLTANYRDHRVKDKAVAASCQNARIKMSVNIEHFKVTSILTLIFRDKKECLKWVFAAIRKLLRWAKTWYCCDLKMEKLREIFCRSRLLWSSSSASLCWAWKTERNSMQRNFQNWNCRFWPTVEFRIFWDGSRNYICGNLE